MKKIILFSTLICFSFFTQIISQEPETPKAAKESTIQAKNSFPWGICIGGLIVIGTLAGVAAGCASTNTKISH